MNDSADERANVSQDPEPNTAQGGEVGGGNSSPSTTNADITPDATTEADAPLPDTLAALVAALKAVFPPGMFASLGDAAARLAAATEAAEAAAKRAEAAAKRAEAATQARRGPLDDKTARPPSFVPKLGDHVLNVRWSKYTDVPAGWTYSYRDSNGAKDGTKTTLPPSWTWGVVVGLRRDGAWDLAPKVALKARDAQFVTEAHNVLVRGPEDRENGRVVSAHVDALEWLEPSTQRKGEEARKKATPKEEKPKEEEPREADTDPSDTTGAGGGTNDSTSSPSGRTLRDKMSGFDAWTHAGAPEEE